MKTTNKQTDTATDYARKIVDGSIVSNRWIRAAAEKHLERIDNPPKGYTWKPEEPETFFDWCRDRITIRTHGKAIPFDPLPWQRFALGLCLGYVDGEGHPMVRTAALEVARGAGKSAIMLGLLLWKLTNAKEPHGQYVVVAQSLQQLAALYVRPAIQIAGDSGLDIQCSTITNVRPWIRCKATESAAVLCAGRARTIQGYTPTMALIDEGGETVEGDPEEALSALEMAVAKDRRCQLVSITTPPPTELSDGPYMRRRVGWIQSVEDDDPSTLFLPWGIDAEPEPDDLDDEAAWPKAYPAFGVIQSVEDYRRDLALARRQENVGEFERRRLCRWNTRGGLWIPGEWLERAEHPFDPEEMRGAQCFAGLDCSKSIDVTSLAVVWPLAGGSVLSASWHFFPTPESRSQRYRSNLETWADLEHVHVADGPLVDYGEVRRRLDWLVDTFEVVEINVDRYSAKGDTTVAELMAEARWPLKTCSQTAESMGGPTTQLRTWLACDSRHDPILRIRPCPVIRYALGCCRVEVDWAGNPRISKRRSTDSVDSIVALIMAGKSLIDSIPQRSAFENPSAII